MTSLRSSTDVSQYPWLFFIESPLYRNNKSHRIARIFADPLHLWLKFKRSEVALDRKVTCFELLFDESEEAFCVRAVNHAMVETQGEIGHPTDADEVVAIGRRQHFRTFFYLANAENRELWLIDYRCPKQPAKHARIRNRKGPASN